MVAVRELVHQLQTHSPLAATVTESNFSLEFRMPTKNWQLVYRAFAEVSEQIVGIVVHIPDIMHGALPGRVNLARMVFAESRHSTQLRASRIREARTMDKYRNEPQRFLIALIARYRGKIRISN